MRNSCSKCKSSCVHNTYFQLTFETLTHSSLGRTTEDTLPTSDARIVDRSPHRVAYIRSKPPKQQRKWLQQYKSKIRTLQAPPSTTPQHVHRATTHRRLGRLRQKGITLPEPSTCMEAMVRELIQVLGNERAEECFNGLLNNLNPEEVARWLTDGVYYVRDEDLSVVTIPLTLFVGSMELSFTSQQSCSMSTIILAGKYECALRKRRKCK